MIPSKSKRSDSRRSSILKPRKPRQPLQNVNFDSSSNVNSPAASKVRRRVSFAEKKHVKEFCHSTEQGTVWDNTYEEHDVSLKGSFDQKAEAESEEKASLSAPNNDCTCIHSESNLCYPNNTYLVNNQLSQESITGANEENNDTNCDLDFINPVNSTELSNISQLECAALTSKSCVSRDAVLSGIVAYSDSDEECMPEEKSQSEQITNISKNVKSSNIMIYRDSDEEDCMDNVSNNFHSKSCSNNVDSELDKTHVQDLSMKLTAPISTPLLSSHLHTEEQKGEERNNLDSNYTVNYNNVSMEITEAIPIFAKSVVSNLEISKQIPKILHSYENRKGDAANTCNTIFSTNLQSNIVPKNISGHTPDVNYANDSMVLTSVIPTLTDLHVTSTGICRTNNTAFDTSMEMVIVPSKMYEEKANNENIVKRNDQREAETVIFNDVPMEMTKPIGTTLFSNVCNQENFRVDDPISRDDGPMFFHNVSMEMTKTVSTKNRQEVTDTITFKSLSEENAHSGKDVNISACLNEETKILCKSMEFTEAVPVSLYHEKMFHAAHIAQSNKNTCENHENDRTEFFNDASMEITKSVVNTIPFNIDKENLKIDEFVSKNDKTILFHNVSMEMTTAMSARNEKEITQPITCKSISEESIHGEKDTNNSTYFNKGTKLFCKSMEFTEIVQISSHNKRTFDTTDTPRTTQPTSFSQTSKAISVPAENSAGVAFQVDAIANETIHDVSMEITAAVPSTLHFTQDTKVNKTENLIIPKNDGFQHPMTNNDLTKLRVNVIKENFTISREIVETEDIRHDELSNVTQSLLDNLDHSLSASLENASGKKRTSDENERSCSKRVCSSFMEVESSQENDVHLFPSTSVNNNVNNVKRNECFVTDIIDHTQVPDSNLRDSLNEISEYSFIRKSLPYLENSLVELQSIKPPSFVCLDSEEENSFRGIQHEPQSSTITDVPINNTSNRLIINDSIESEYLINSRENVTNDYFAILREKEETINTEGNKAEDCHKSTIMEKTDDNLEKKTNCQVIAKTIVNDNRLNKSMNYTKNINEESILSMNAKNERPVTVQDVNHCTSLIIKEIEVIDEAQTNERECVRKRINEDAKLENNIEEKRQYLDRKRQETEKCSNHPEDTGTVEAQIDPKEHEQNLNDEIKQQSMEQKDECAAGKLVTAHVSTIDVKNGSFAEQDPFLTLLQKLETYSLREDCIWSVYYKDINKKMIVFGFISSSLLIATFLSDDFNGSEKNLIKRIKVVSRISDETGVLIKIVHKLILEKINAEILENLYTTHQDILPMLNFISQDVKLAMDFMFDLRRLDNLNLMEIARDEISFISQSKRMDIILRVTIKVKRFDKLTRNDINFYCLLGKVKETDIKDLIKNIKRDHKFLRRYMNDVKDYIDIMEETFK